MPLVFPIVHLGGTSGDELVRCIENAVAAIVLAENALRTTEPHARDYYVRDDVAAFEQARQEYQSRYDRLRSVRSELGVLWDAVLEQLEDGRFSTVHSAADADGGEK